MKKNLCEFHVKGLNQEKYLNKLIQDFKIYNYDRISKDEFKFCVSYFNFIKVKKFLNNNNFTIISLKKYGILQYILNLFTSYGVIAGLIVSSIFIFIQNFYITNYQVIGVENLSKSEVISYVKDNFSKKKNSLNSKEIEYALFNNFEEISYASVIVKGQTLVINIKEKLLPNEIYGEFSPLYSAFDGKITAIELISGTLQVKVGDVVKKGDILVLPYVADSQGEEMKVEAKANIYADTWVKGVEQHFDICYQTYRTGKVIENSEIYLFGLSIYENKKEVTFETYEEISYTENFSQNNLLPFKIKKSVFYETKTILVEENFDDVKDKIVEKARSNALENAGDYDTIDNEFYTIDSSNGVTIVSYVLTINRLIGSMYEN